MSRFKETSNLVFDLLEQSVLRWSLARSCLSRQLSDSICVVKVLTANAWRVG